MHEKVISIKLISNGRLQPERLCTKVWLQNEPTF